MTDKFISKYKFAIVVVIAFIVLFALSMGFCVLTAASPTLETGDEDISPIAKSENVDVSNTVEPEEDVLSYSDDDLYYLAAAVCREAGGQSEEIQLLVANVIINRVNSTLYPNTIYGVLTQKSQYGTMWKYGVSFPSWATESIKAQCYSVAKRILDGERYCPDSVLFQAEFIQGSRVYKYFEEGYYFCYY